MEVQEVTVFIGPDGTVKLEVRGVKGKRCLELTEDIEKILGGEVVERVMTPEYEAQAEATVDEITKIKSGE